MQQLMVGGTIKVIMQYHLRQLMVMSAILCTCVHYYCSHMQGVATGIYCDRLLRVVFCICICVIVIYILGKVTALGVLCCFALLFA